MRVTAFLFLAFVGLTSISLPAQAAMSPGVFSSPYDCANLREQERRLMEKWYEQCFDDGGEWLGPPCD